MENDLVHRCSTYHLVLYPLYPLFILFISSLSLSATEHRRSSRARVTKYDHKQFLKKLNKSQIFNVLRIFCENRPGKVLFPSTFEIGQKWPLPFYLCQTFSKRPNGSLAVDIHVDAKTQSKNIGMNMSIH